MNDYNESDGLHPRRRKESQARAIVLKALKLEK
jgi:hypothetical protein